MSDLLFNGGDPIKNYIAPPLQLLTSSISPAQGCSV